MPIAEYGGRLLLRHAGRSIIGGRTVAHCHRGTTMSDDLHNRGPADRSRVNVNESWEVRYWCKEFGCTETQLRAAVKAVGVSVVAVRAHLKK
ncbi:hypothetical protein UUA_09091 [Rhodanobacter thiooxydans LCS2]|nr:hypothetical protein UUA_09091 [Rhodanobacter thiooxydans LCS2]